MDFLKKNKRFSFKLDGVDFKKLEHKVSVAEENDCLTTVISFPDGLTVTNVAEKHMEYGAYEWVNYIENTGNEPTGVISELWDCNVSLPSNYEEPMRRTAYIPIQKKATKVYAPSGSNQSGKEFFCDVDCFEELSFKNHIQPGDVKKYSCEGGRSSDGSAPFFNISKDGAGYIVAIGWSGQWSCEIGRSARGVTFKSKVADTEFRVLPGERFRTSSVLIMPYADITEAHNLWRRLLKSRFSLLGEERRAKRAPLCAGIWGGMSTADALLRLEKIKESKLPYEYIWMDAGWYGESTKPTPDEFEGDWYMHTGDWRVSKNIHPGGLEDFSKAVHEAGLKFLLWFEPERVVKGTPISIEHPEYLLSNGDPDNKNLLLNLGNNDAFKYCFNMLSDFIERLNINCYRNDFNISPLLYWQYNDTPERKGITEIKYINGLYELWDALLEKFPRLIIDNCASGGKRIDIEALRRSVPLWRSDVMCHANYNSDLAQCNSLTYNLWMPYSGTGTGREYDEYRIRSAYAAAMTSNYSFSKKDGFCETAEQVAFLKKYLNEYVRVRPFFSEDFYPLTDASESRGAWSAMQFNRPVKGDGIVMAFRREGSPFETAAFEVKGIDEKATYIVTDFDIGKYKLTGKELIEDGFKVTIKTKRKAKIYYYNKL